MMTIWTKLRNWTLAIVILGIIAILAYLWIKYHKSAKDADIITTVLTQTPKTFTDKNGNTHHEFVTQETSEATIIALRDSLKIELKKNTGSVQSLTTFVYKTDTVFASIPVYVDTSKGQIIVKFSKKDDYLQIDAEANLITNQAEFHVDSKDTLVYIEELENRFLRSSIRKVDIINKNPYNHILEGSSVVITEPKSLIDIDLSVGYNPFTQKPIVGITAGIHLFSIKTKK